MRWLFPLPPRSRAAVIDPTGGLADLDRKLIRHTNESAMTDDPVRALRAVRLAKQLGFEVAPDTWELASRAALQLETVSPERIRDELLKILVGPYPDEALARHGNPWTAGCGAAGNCQIKSGSAIIATLRKCSRPHQIHPAVVKSREPALY